MSIFSQNPFYHAIVKKSVVAFGNLFSDIILETREATETIIVRSIKCPISYANKQQWFVRLREDPDFLRKFETELPRLSFEITDYRYNPDKKMGGQLDNILYNCMGSDAQIYAPVPYRLTFQLYSYTKNQEEALQILEQILPYFGPSVTVNIDLLPLVNMNMDIPISLDGVQVEDNYQDLGSNRMIIQTFTFNMDIQLFGPANSNVNVIKKAIVDLNFKPGIEHADMTYTASVNPQTAEGYDDPTFIGIDEMWAGQI